MFDAHCHLDDPALSADLERRRELGATGWFCAGFEPARWQVQKKLRAPDLWHAVGLHPWSRSEWDPQQLEAELDQGWACAVGECGLDFAVAREPAARERQQSILAEHLAIARRRALPVVLHVVRAHRQMLDLLDAEGPVAGLVHAFAGTPGEARDFIQRGLSVSLGPHSLKNEATVACIPADRLLLETDAPGRGARLSDLDDVLARVAEIRQLDRSMLATRTGSNALALLA